MKTRLLSGIHVFCCETIVPEKLGGLQLSFNQLRLAKAKYKRLS